MEVGKIKETVRGARKKRKKIEGRKEIRMFGKPYIGWVVIKK